MKITCEFCQEYMSDTDENCPHCGAKNPHFKRQSNNTPKTIEELKKWYEDHNLPPQSVTRFFIGVNTKEPKAFGIYQDGDLFIVYKNKADGSRAVRYEGKDEAYAVHELYQKLKERIAEQKSNNHKNKKSGSSSNDSIDPWPFLICGGIFLAIIIYVVSGVLGPSNGYYSYQDDQYYYLGGDWYVFDSYDFDWNETTVDDELESNSSDYYESDSYSIDYGTSDFEDTSYYKTWDSEQDNDSDWDSDSTWDSGDSWDSDSGDWDSDW